MPSEPYTTGGAGPILANSAMIVPDPNAPAAPIGVVVPITATPIETGLLTAAELTELTGTGGSLRAQLDAVDGTSAILAVDPAIAAAINVLGTSAPPEATEWLERLEALTNPRFALQFGDADVSAQLASGLSRPMAPLTLQSLLNPAFFVPPAPTSAPTPTPTPDRHPPSRRPSPCCPTSRPFSESAVVGAASSGRRRARPARASSTPSDNWAPTPCPSLTAAPVLRNGRGRDRCDRRRARHDRRGRGRTGVRLRDLRRAR